jgi:hypothetical protein
MSASISATIAWNSTSYSQTHWPLTFSQ